MSLHHETVNMGGHRAILLDPALFWRKLTMLIVFFGLFIPLKMYREELLVWYVVFLVALHVYILFIFLYRVQWRVLAQNRRDFLVRLVAITVFVVLLTVIKAGATLQELLVFVALSGIVHVALLLSLTVHIERASPAQPLATDA